jgi:hypothetical protein
VTRSRYPKTHLRTLEYNKSILHFVVSIVCHGTRGL